MSKSINMTKYYIAISLIIFFSLVILVGGIRLLSIKENSKAVDLSNIDNILEEETSIDMTSINLRIKNSIEQEYGVDVYFGDGYYVESVNAVPITNQNEIFEMLKSINYALSKYPSNMIDEIESKGYTVSIYLVSYFTNGIDALANRNSIGEFKIYMSNTLDVERTMHHEYYHILDYYIKLETNEHYYNWDEYNPEGFKYTQDVNGLTNEYVYTGDKTAYFVTLYAKYSEKEDRAETFAEMITADKTEYLKQENILGKMNLIKDVLRTCFNAVAKEKQVIWE